MRRVILLSILVSLLFLLPGCAGDDQPALTLTLPAGTPAETVAVIRAVAPSMEERLPGLVKYHDSMQLVGVSPAHDVHLADGSWVKIVSLAFQVAGDGGAIPADYQAGGHRIEIGIFDNGKALVLQKRQAQAVFLDRPSPSPGTDLVIKL
jgi:hypothetical protein